MFGVSINFFYSIVFSISLVVGLSLAFDIAYIYTLLVLSALVAFGHLMTLDDDMPGEWENMDESQRIWFSSKVILVIKIGIFISFIAAILFIPSVRTFGA